MDLHLDGKVALITGASRGLGRATALALAREGADVVIAARNEGPLIEVADAVRELGQRALTVTADAGRPEDRERLVSQALDSFGHVDVLVSNATSLDLYGTDAPDMAFWNVPVARGSTVEITQLRRAFAATSQLVGSGRSGCASGGHHFGEGRNPQARRDQPVSYAFGEEDGLLVVPVEQNAVAPHRQIDTVNGSHQAVNDHAQNPPLDHVLIVEHRAGLASRDECPV